MIEGNYENWKTVTAYQAPLHEFTATGYTEVFTVEWPGMKSFPRQFTGSTMPNGYHPKTKDAWQYVYGWIAPGTYHLKCIEHKRFGKCLIINGGDMVGTHNRRDKGQYMTACYIHRLGTGKNTKWRGSAGCLGFPIHDGTWDKFISLFELNEEATLIVKEEA